ncbi:hypothetical protein CHARACLAT_010224 [Characodon lateralis]|uniref:Uncharacterized protein n=1 Tax=Characodon lateralis TaxID=208331 RepID=A0ABU7CPF8_9TELE|nr:hypothetical protein [Characodon lateralis]
MLDLMFLTETLLRAGEVAPCWNFASQIPASSALLGCLGGERSSSIIKACYKCKQSPGVFISFESQLFILGCPVVLIIGIFHPPNYDDLFYFCIFRLLDMFYCSSCPTGHLVISALKQCFKLTLTYLMCCIAPLSMNYVWPR